MKPTIRASGLDRFLACPGSAVLNARIPATESGTSVTWEGNWCHWKAAMRLIAEQNAVVPEGGLPAPEMPEDYRPNNFATWIVDYFVDTVIDLTDTDQALLVEQEFGWEFERFILTGHIDAFGVSGDGKRIVAFDLKAGNLAVDSAEVNNQVLAYIVLLFLAYEPEEVTFAIVQPRNDGEEAQRVSTVRVTAEEFPAVLAHFESQVHYALDNPRELNSGPKQCRYCPAAMTCPAIQQDIEMAKLTLTDEALEQLAHEPDDERLIELECLRKTLEPRFDKAKEMLKWRLELNGEIALPDGRRAFLKERAGRRSITDPLAAAKVLEDLPDELYYNAVTFSPAKIEEALKAHLKLPATSKKKHSAKAEYENRLGAITVQPNYKIVAISEG